MRSFQHWLIINFTSYPVSFSTSRSAGNSSRISSGSREGYSNGNSNSTPPSRWVATLFSPSVSKIAQLLSIYNINIVIVMLLDYYYYYTSGNWSSLIWYCHIASGEFPTLHLMSLSDCLTRSHIYWNDLVQRGQWYHISLPIHSEMCEGNYNPWSPRHHNPCKMESLVIRFIIYSLQFLRHWMMDMASVIEDHHHQGNDHTPLVYSNHWLLEGLQNADRCAEQHNFLTLFW